jgi:hypothetical protein
MKKHLILLSVLASLALASNTQAAVTIGWAAAAGNMRSSTDTALTSGGVSIGYFVSAPSDAAFGTTINSWADVLGAGYIDVRTLPGVSLGTLDWDYPLAGGGGSVTGVPFTALATTATAIALNTQLYVFAFNGGSFNLATPASSFGGSTEWAVVKDNANLAPADLGTRNVLLSNAVGGEILRGTDNGSNVNLTSLAVVPEPSRAVLLALGLFSLFARRRR